MKNFIQKILLYTVIVFFVGMILVYQIPNANYSNPYLESKIDYLEKNSQEFNTLFIGSSKINNQVDCKVIDSINPQLHSYNLGTNAGFNPENFNTLRRIVSNEKLSSIQVIVLDLQNLINISRNNIFSERSYNPYNYSNLWFTQKFHWENRAYAQMGYSAVSFMMNVFHYKKTLERTKEDSVTQWVIRENQGIFPLDRDSNPQVLKRKENLESHPKEIQERIHQYYQMQNPKANESLILELEKLQRLCQANNIQLILLAPAPAEPTGKEILDIKKRISVPVIENLDPKENPEFYTLANRWDYGHLNQKGAEIFSRKTALQLKEIVKN